MSHNCTTQDWSHCTAGSEAIHSRWLQWPDGCPAWLPTLTTHTNRQVSITGSVWFPILESLLSVPLCNLTVVQQHKISSNWVSAGRDPKHRNPWLLYPHSLCVLVPVVIFVLVAVSGWPDAPHAHWWFFAWGSRCFPSPRTQCATYTEATCTRCICKIRIGYFSEKDSLKAMKKWSDF